MQTAVLVAFVDDLRDLGLSPGEIVERLDAPEWLVRTTSSKTTRCSWPGCGQQVVDGRYCDEHKSQIPPFAPTAEGVRRKHWQVFALSDAVAELRKYDLSYGEIAGRLGITAVYARQLARKDGRLKSNVLPSKHGTDRRWQGGCRCGPCTDAMRIYQSIKAEGPLIYQAKKKAQEIAPKWTKDDDMILRLEVLTISEMAGMLGRTWMAVFDRREQLGLAKVKAGNRNWSEAEIELLNRKDLTDNELSIILGRTERSVELRRQSLKND